MSQEASEAKYLKSARVRLKNRRGLHARAAAKFVAIANKYKSKIEVTSLNDICRETVMADSTMELLLLGSACGEEISITAHGPDAKQALEELCQLVQNRFGEKE